MFNNKPISLVNNYYLFEYNKTIIQPFIYMKIVPKSIIKNITLTADCP